MRSGSFGPLEKNVLQASRDWLWVQIRPQPLALPVRASFLPTPAPGPALSCAPAPPTSPPTPGPSAWPRPPHWAAAGPAHPSLARGRPRPPFPGRGRRPRGGAGREEPRSARGRGIRCGVTGKLVRVPGVSCLWLFGLGRPVPRPSARLQPSPPTWSLLLPLAAMEQPPAPKR